MRRRWGARRFDTLDTIRGITLISMILYHASWDLVYLYGVDWPFYHTRWAYLWQQSICWTFILLSGYCFHLGSRRVKRGLMVFGGGALVSLVTLLAMPDAPIIWGVLTLLGSAALLTIPLDRKFSRIPAEVGAAGSFGLFILLRNVNAGFLGFERWNLLALPQWLYHNTLTAFVGFPHDAFYSADYFSLIPWLFLFWTGYFLYRLQKPNRGGTYLPVVTAMGRHSLLIYLLHQPVTYGLLEVLSLLGLL